MFKANSKRQVLYYGFLCLLCFGAQSRASKTGSTFQQTMPSKSRTNTGHRQNPPEIISLSPANAIISDSNLRTASFMVDPLIIIALIALPTIGMLGLSSLIMPLIPIGIYLIQQFFPTSAGKRRRRNISFPKGIHNDQVDNLLRTFISSLRKFEH